MVNGYYETVFADMVNEGCLSFTPVFFDASRWYEIDTIADLRAAEKVCDLYHHPAAIMTGRALNNQKDSGNSSAFKHIKAISRTQRAPHRHQGIEMSTTMTSVSTLPQ